MRRQRHLQQAASRFLRQSLVNHLSREQSCLQMIDRTFPSCPSSWSEPNLLYWIILSRIRFRFLSEPRGWAPTIWWCEQKGGKRRSTRPPKCKATVLESRPSQKLRRTGRARVGRRAEETQTGHNIRVSVTCSHRRG